MLPKDFISYMQSLPNLDAGAFFQSYEQVCARGLRLNPLKKEGLQPESLNRLLSDPAPVPWAENGYYYTESDHPGKHPYHEAGAYYIQEPSAMSAAVLLHPAPGERVLDLCGAPGGKSTQLAAFLNGSGLLISNEIHPARCKILSQNIERMGIANAIVTNEDSASLSSRFPEYFDKILVDAPCSGEGMFRKDPDACDQWQPANVDACALRQKEILENAASMLHPSGTLVYSTCTFSAEENEQVIAWFLKHHPEFHLISADDMAAASFFAPGHPEWADQNPELTKTCRLWPHLLKGEGHFAAILKKAENRLQEPASSKSSKSLKSSKKSRNSSLSKSLRSLLDDFLIHFVTADCYDFLLSGDLILFGDQLYRLPKDAPPLDGLKILRAGLHLGTFRKGRFEPAHALALFLGRQEVLNHIDFPAGSDEVLKFFRGESFPVPEQTQNGWCLFCVDHMSAGFGKVSGGMFKNHYPKGLRKEFL